MRKFLVLFMVGLLMACQRAEIKPNEVDIVTTDNDVEVVEESIKQNALDFLLTASAKDFVKIKPSADTLMFRNVKLGQIHNPDDSIMYMLCGEFKYNEVMGQNDWVEFATLKTSGYEQWLGIQAKVLCQQPKIIWDMEGDMASLMRARVNMYR